MNHRIASLILVFAVLLALLSGCKEAEKVEGPAINGTPLASYAIVYSEDDTDYALRAAEYLQAQILARTGVELPLQEDSAVTATHEIVVGNTERQISALLEADTSRDQFALMSAENQVALEGDYFLIAAAAYYFVQTYITAGDFVAQIPDTPTICQPITEAPNKYILLIGDGMGPNHVDLFSAPPLRLSKGDGFSDVEDIFYGYLLPNHGFSKTDSLTGVTDSAAGGTALACGYKTYNKYIGQNSNHEPVKSLTELANELGMATAVMSTEARTGATPSSFSAHSDERTAQSAILASQKILEEAGTLIRCDFNFYDDRVHTQVEAAVQETLAQLEQDPEGFFLMYEEAHIDKHSHSNDLTGTFMALVRFDQVIGTIMEYAFYHPDTFVLITADHETGKLKPAGSVMAFHSESHSGADVPIFAFGQGSEVFDGATIENIQIPKTIAKIWGVTDFGDPLFDAL